MDIKKSSFKVGDHVVAISHPYDRVCCITKIDPDGYFYCDEGSYVNPAFMRLAYPEEHSHGYRLPNKIDMVLSKQ